MGFVSCSSPPRRSSHPPKAGLTMAANSQRIRRHDCILHNSRGHSPARHIRSLSFTREHPRRRPSYQPPSLYRYLYNGDFIPPLPISRYSKSEKSWMNRGPPPPPREYKRLTARSKQLAKASTLALISMLIIILTVTTQGFRVPADSKGKLGKDMLLINDGVFQAIGVISFGSNPFPPKKI